MSDDGGRTLEDMALEELWELFPIILCEHDFRWTTWFQEESAALAQALGSDAVRISHIGSTAVPRLFAKPTVDVLLELGTSMSVISAVDALTGIGWRQMYGSDGEPLRLGFNKGYTPAGFAERVFHLHVRRPDDPDELYFRDYLRDHREVCEEYTSLKRDLAQRFEHDRDAYTEAKSTFIGEMTARARTAYGPRYRFEDSVKS